MRVIVWMCYAQRDRLERWEGFSGKSLYFISLIISFNRLGDRTYFLCLSLPRLPLHSKGGYQEGEGDKQRIFRERMPSTSLAIVNRFLPHGERRPAVGFGTNIKPDHEGLLRRVWGVDDQEVGDIMFVDYVTLKDRSQVARSSGPA